MPAIRAALEPKRVVALSPLVGGRALRGPLVEMLVSLGHEPTAGGVRRLYGDLVTTFVVDPVDAGTDGAVVAPAVMVAPEARGEVGRAILDAVL